jgi:hypothetical protein
MVGEILLGIFGNTIYDVIKTALKETFIDKDDDLIGRIHTALEETSKQFFVKYGNQFGEPSSSFLARQANIDTIVKSIFYENNFELIKELSPKGFDGAYNVNQEALYFFTKKLNECMMKDFRLNKIIVEKKHIIESKEDSIKILDILNNLIQQKQIEGNPEGTKGWIIKDAFGNETPLIEGKQYILKFPNGIETTYMFKKGLIYVDFLDKNGQKSYYELDFNGNVKNTKFPYELSEYKIVISDDQIVHKNVIQLSNDYYREVIKLKWDKQADVIYNLKGELQQMDLQGGWEVKHLERIIIPKI